MSRRFIKLSLFAYRYTVANISRGDCYDHFTGLFHIIESFEEVLVRDL